MSSRNHSDAYAKFSGYIGQPAKSNNGSYKTYDQLDNKPQPQQNIAANVDRFANAPPPKQGMQSAPQPPIPQKSIPQFQQQPQEQSHRVKTFDHSKLHELLVNPNYHKAKNGQPVKIFVKVSTEWCGPCKKIAPHIQQLSLDPKYSDILFVEVDGDSLMGTPLSKIINVSAVPVFFGFVSGKQLGDFVAGADLKGVVGLCDRLASL